MLCAMTMDEDETQPPLTDRTPIGDVVEPEPLIMQDPETVPDGEETPENGGP